MNLLQEYVDWLNGAPDPDTVEDSPEGGKHIPIDKLKPLLSELDPSWSTRSLWVDYKEIGGTLFVSSSVELVVNYGGISRTLVGAATFDVADYTHIGGHYAAIGLTNAVKNAAMNLGRRFGSELNVTEEDTFSNPVKTKTKRKAGKMKPDSKIMMEYMNACVANDREKMQKLVDIYEIKTEDDYAQKD